jgi:hypothetical protein
MTTLSAAVLRELHQLPDDALLDTREAAAFLHISPRTLAWYRTHRIGPAYAKIGRVTVRYRAGDLREYSGSLRPGIGRPKQAPAAAEHAKGQSHG